MKTVVGVRFRNAGKVYFFEPGNYEVKRGTAVIVETARGIEFGTCVNDPYEIGDEQIVSPLKPIMRIASEADIKQAAENRVREKEAYKTCQQKIIEHGLEMKLIDAEYTFDNSKVLFYFTADGRVDFRELVKDLASVFRTRIELRQVGVRDETKILGGMGICGRPLCCHSYLSDFVPVSIKMAKEQNLSLNPSKISGVCGRLMCCLNNEEEVYEEQNRKLPGAGDYVTTSLGERGIVQSTNIFRETVRVLVQNGDEKELKEYHADEIRFKKRRKKGKLDLSPEELEQLRAMEPEEVAELTAELAREDEVESDYEESIEEEIAGMSDTESRVAEKSGNDRAGNRGRNNSGRDNNRDNNRGNGGRDNNRNNGGNGGRDNNVGNGSRDNSGGNRNENRDRNNGNRNENRDNGGRDANRDANANRDNSERENGRDNRSRNRRNRNRNKKNRTSNRGADNG